MGSSVFPAASSGPSLAEITTAIQNNGSAFSGTWTSLYSGSPAANATSVTVSGLGSYKYLRVRWSVVANSTGNNFWVRFNGDAGSNYNDHRGYITPSFGPFTAVSAGNGTTQFNFRRCSGSASEVNIGGFEVYGSNQSGVKALASQEHMFNDGSYYGLGQAVSTWRSNAAITSITLLMQPSAGFDSSTIFWVDGAN